MEIKSRSAKTVSLCAFKLVMLTMPSEGLWIRQEMKVRGAEHFASCHFLEQVSLLTHFLEAVFGNDHA
ncbi:MAG: hypothetical protein A3B81_06170 [Candidatus Muproteobacteria bacterium RIFCSPHIGHO2_02_FULL_65_16]|uniref:Uncharacterized protein n=1 Tax=Candidatus Muproteobacteria bacterium RIFCSPHIGHO2_02_FULL_65_16 TaxID=1817766 RepID=A0A1F6U577_9PROT|nr:MAG: hypothetical protein A3B81_06170 [Candidatus Muproteobacteria bacterium RIFCSPHIGHO2_02_FULL_65_16]